MAETQSEGNQLLYSTFRVLDTLGRGGMGYVFKVRAERNSKGFKQFLASAIAWQEVKTHREIAPLRSEITKMYRKVLKLFGREAKLMDEGDEEKAESVRAEIDSIKGDILSKVETLKAKQELFVEKRSSQVARVSAEKMIKYLRKIGLNYPDNDIFAMKQIRVDVQEYLSRLQDEFKSLNLVQHPNILTVYDMGTDYYIMEHLEGNINSKEIIADTERGDGKYTNEHRIRIVIETAKALEHAHMFGVIHRDIKPDNISVDKENHVKLIDFGLVKSVESEGVTMAGFAVGTPYYMSPEQIRKTSEARETFDIYSLGATLYHYLAGEAPYVQARNKYNGTMRVPKTAQEVFMTVCNDAYEPLPPSVIAHGIPEALEDIVLKAMAKESRFRYQSLKEFREDLERYISLAGMETLQSGSYFGIKTEEVPTVVRKRAKVRTVRIRRPRQEPSTARKMLIPALIAAGVLAAGYFYFYTGSKNRQATTDRSMEHERIESAQEKNERLIVTYEYAVKHSDEYPFAFMDNIENFESVIRDGKGTEYENKAHEHLERIQENWRKEREGVMAELNKEALQLIEQDKFDEAAAVYTSYTGICDEGTEEERRKTAARILESRDVTKKMKKTKKEIIKKKKSYAGEKGQWVNLIKGNSKKEARWYCSKGGIKKGHDNFSVQKSKLVLLHGNKRSSISQNLLLGDCKLEFDYDYRAGKEDAWKITIDWGQYYMSFKFRAKTKGSHNIKIAIKGIRIEFRLDGKEIRLDRSEDVAVRFHKESGEKHIKLEKMPAPLEKRGHITFSAGNIDLVISNLRYRLIE